MTQTDIKNIIDKIKKFYADTERTSDLKIKSDLVEDYNNLISLRNRLEYEIESDYIYQDDIISLDYILDFLEIMFDEMINKDELKQIKEKQKGKLVINHKKGEY